MVRSILSTLLVGVAADESLMQFEKASDFHLNVHHARTTAMLESAQSMVNSYQKLLQDMVEAKSSTDPATGKPYVPGKAVLDKVKETFTGLEDQLEQQRLDNQGILDTHGQTVTACNTARQNAFAGADGVVAKMNAMVSARDTHATCRGDEDEAITKMETSCDAFRGLANKCAVKDGQNDQNWFAGNPTDAAPQTLRVVIDKANVCRADVGSVTEIAARCDGDQTTFMAAFCTYEAALTETCSTLDSCHKLASDNLDLADESIKKLQEEQKIIFRMVQKAHCYMNLLFDIAEKKKDFPDQADIQECNDMNFVAKADTDLNINYVEADAKEACTEHPDLISNSVQQRASPSYRPATDDPSDNWYTSELQPYDAHGKLSAVVACS